MKNPKSNYIGEARKIRRTRLIVRSIIAGVVILVVFFAIFFTYILNLKKDIDSEFPSSDSSSTTLAPSEESTAPSSDTSSETEPASTTSETTPPETETTPDPSGTEETGDTTASEGETTSSDPADTSETTVNLLPDDWSDKPTVLFPQKYPLQTVTHSERDQAYSSLKHSVKKYIEDNSDARIGFYYINLNTNEAFGYNEAQPFVVGSAVYLPLTMLMYDDVLARTRSMDIAIPFQKSSLPESTYTKLREVPEGKQFYMWQLAYLALSEGDSAAMNILLDQFAPELDENGDPKEDDLLTRMTKMSACIDYTAVQNYVDYAGVQQSGKHRSSAYDLATFAEKLYWRYMSYPEVYQNMINALGSTDRNCGITRQIPASATVLHRPGRNTDFHSESDVAIILATEPVVVCVTVEAETPEKAQEIQAALGALVYNFINYCHA